VEPGERPRLENRRTPHGHPYLARNELGPDDRGQPRRGGTPARKGEENRSDQRRGGYPRLCVGHCAKPLNHQSTHIVIAPAWLCCAGVGFGGDY